MTLIALPPSISFVSVQWTPPSTKVQVNRSAWTGARRGVRLPGGARWAAKATLPPVVNDPVKESAWAGFLAALDGPFNSFRLPCRTNQHGLAISPVVKAGAIAGATSLVIAGLPASIQILSVGQLMTVILPSGRAQMLILIDNLISNATGEATAIFRAALREAPAAGSAVETVNPFCELSLVGDVPAWTDGLANRTDFEAIDLEEAF